MARTAPDILIERTNEKTYVSTQVLKAGGVYSVFYRGRPINYRKIDTLVDKTAKYMHTSFSSSGPAFNVADKMNKLFHTTDFTVVVFVDGGKIIKEKDND